MESAKFLFPFIGLGLGIFFADKFPSGIPVGLISVGLALALWVVVYSVSKDPLKGIKYRKFHSIWILLLFLGIGAFDFQINGKIFLNKEIGTKECNLKGEITDIKYYADGDRFCVKPISIHDQDGNEIKFKNLKLLLITDGYVASKGDIISFKGIPNKFKSNGSNAVNMEHQGIRYYIKSKTSEINKIGYDNSIFSSFRNLRENLIIKLENSKLHRSTLEFLTSIILGDKTLLSPETKSTLTSAGLGHILALSGMHVAIIYSIIFAILFPLSLIGKNRWRKISAIVLVWLFVIISGASPSTVRAALMATMVAVAFLLERKNSALNALFAAVLLILLFNPLYLWDLGLQLSFIAVLTIIVFANRFNNIEQHIHPLAHKVINLILISLVTTFSTWVLVAYYFGNVPLLFLPANFLLLPFLPIFVGVGMIYTAFLAMGLDLGLLASFLNHFHSIFIGMAEILSLSGQANQEIHLPVMSVILWLGALAMAGLLFSGVAKRYKVAMTCSSLAMAIASVILIGKYELPSEKTIYFTNNFTHIEARVKAAEKSTRLIFPRNNISTLEIANLKVTSVDQRIHPDSLDIIKGAPAASSVLLVGSHADFNQIKDLIENCNFNKIIIHSSLGKNQKERLLGLIDVSHWEKVHLLQENGSLQLSL